MKSALFLIILSFSSALFAQDGYHSYPTETCEAGEHCLVDENSDWVIKMVSWENEQGEIDGSKLSSDSFLADTVYKDAKLCYRGTVEQVCDLLEVMSNADGGDAVIRSFSCKKTENKVDIKYSVEYYGYGIDTFETKIKKCE